MVLLLRWSITFSLIEQTTRSEDPKPELPPQRSVWGTTYTPYQPTTYSYSATGHLTLKITNIAGMGTRASWSDGKRQRLEDCLTTFVEHLGYAAEALKVARREAEERRLEVEARERRWLEEERHRREEQRLIEKLGKEAAAWRTACGLREYAEAALQRLDELCELSDEQEVRRDELEWALAYADRIDPLHRREG